MGKVFEQSELLQNLKKTLHDENEKQFKERVKNAPPLTDMEKADQRYVDGIRRSCAEYHEKYGKE